MLGSKRSSNSSSSCRRRLVQGVATRIPIALVPAYSTDLAYAVRLHSSRWLAADSLLGCASLPNDAGEVPAAAHPDSPEWASKGGESHLSSAAVECARHPGGRSSASSLAWPESAPDRLPTARSQARPASARTNVHAR